MTIELVLLLLITPLTGFLWSSRSQHIKNEIALLDFSAMMIVALQEEDLEQQQRTVALALNTLAKSGAQIEGIRFVE